MSFYARYPATVISSIPLPVGAATAANQAFEISDLDAIKASAASIDTKLTNPLPVSGPLTDTQLRATAVPVSVASSIAVTGPLTDAELRATAVPVSGTVTANTGLTQPLTDTQLRATAVPVSMASSPLPTGAATETTLSAFSSKTASAAVTVPFDYQAISYVGATTNIDQVIFKTGGASGTIVATLTMGYDGSSRLTSVTKS